MAHLLHGSGMLLLSLDCCMTMETNCCMPCWILQVVTAASPSDPAYFVRGVAPFLKVWISTVLWLLSCMILCTFAVLHASTVWHSLGCHFLQTPQSAPPAPEDKRRAAAERLLAAIYVIEVRQVQEWRAFPCLPVS
jgi:hypothetical protein